ncbi:wax ester/triacylglycerol synthase family O-acyltransferase [Streptomyces sp. NBC_01275]|uniref:wax ester/triacylglycerol synthase domain-containing protein n=1 Tax=Streptomyces sp. NBC_01275 TaxID=2903807 RepID=UPI0022546C95|nr:wax ester/triacylglycerol synthase domain-containing protein [Streptomyces sp. NBC_01275]MCX4763611.1 wax ester/triacylglycerol synthase family O-acyltransferase [Streptomyces sp. NBC_01275]
MAGSHLPFMEEGMARWPFGPPHAGLALECAGTPPPLEELRALAAERWAALPRLAHLLVPPARGPGRRHRWATDEGSYDLTHQVVRTDSTLQEGLREWFQRPFPADRPPWNLHLLRGAADGHVGGDTDGGFALLFRMHHSLLDGRSVTTLLRALLDGGRPVDAPASLAAPGARRRTVEPAIGGPPGMLTTGLPVPLPGKGERRPAHTAVRLPADLLRAAREAARGRTATTNDVFLAAASGVLRSCLLTSADGLEGGSGLGSGLGSTAGARQVWLSVPVDQRPSECGDFLGNAFTNVRVPAPVTLPDPAARLIACGGLLTAVTRPRRTAERLIEGALGAFPGTTQALARGKFFAAAYAPAACSYVHLREGVRAGVREGFRETGVDGAAGRTLAGRPLRYITAVPMVPPDDTVTFALGGCAQGHTLSVATNSGDEDADLLADAFLHELGLLAGDGAR